MSDALDLGPIKARLAATTPGDWKWVDEILRDVPYDDASWINDKPIATGNDGSLGVMGLFVETPTDEDESDLDPILEARDDDDDIPEDPDDPGSADLNKWRGVIQVGNVADLEFIAAAKADVEVLLAEVERLRALVES